MSRKSPESTTPTLDKPARKRKSPVERANAQLAKIVNLLAWFQNSASLSEEGENYVTRTIDEHVESLAQEWKRRRSEETEKPKDIEINIPE